MYYLALDYHKGHAIFFTQIKITQEKSRIKPFAFTHTKVCSSTNWKLEFKKNNQEFNFLHLCARTCSWAS